MNTRFLPNKVLLLADGGPGQKQLAGWLPFVEGVRRLKDRATAYVCENYVCKLPTADPETMGASWTISNRLLHRDTVLLLARIFVRSAESFSVEYLSNVMD